MNVAMWEMTTGKPLWYRVLWYHGWRPRLFTILEDLAYSFQYPFSPFGFVAWGDYDGDFHLFIGDRDVCVDWRGDLVARGTNVGEGKGWAVSRKES